MNEDSNSPRSDPRAPGAQVSERWARWRAELSIERYEARFAALDRAGRSAHGEADFIEAYRPRRVLDAGCGTGRVAIELQRRGIDTVGVDLDGEMVQTAANKAPHITWITADLDGLDRNAFPGSAVAGLAEPLAEPFDIVAMPGNVMLFCRAASRAGIVSSLAHLVRADGLLIAGFSLHQGVTLDEYDRWCDDAGLIPADRFAGWDREPFVDDPSKPASYVVTVHRPAP